MKADGSAMTKDIVGTKSAWEHNDVLSRAKSAFRFRFDLMVSML